MLRFLGECATYALYINKFDLAHMHAYTVNRNARGGKYFRFLSEKIISHMMTVCR